jgi:hypothetical protein
VGLRCGNRHHYTEYYMWSITIHYI